MIDKKAPKETLDLFHLILKKSEAEEKIRETVKRKIKQYLKELYSIKKNFDASPENEECKGFLYVIIFLDIIQSMEFTDQSLWQIKNDIDERTIYITSALNKLSHMFINNPYVHDFLPQIVDAYLEGSKYQVAVHFLALARRINDKQLEVRNFAIIIHNRKHNEAPTPILTFKI